MHVGRSHAVDDGIFAMLVCVGILFVCLAVGGVAKCDAEEDADQLLQRVTTTDAEIVHVPIKSSVFEAAAETLRVRGYERQGDTDRYAVFYRVAPPNEP